MYDERFLAEKQRVEAEEHRRQYRLPLHAPPHGVRSQSDYLITAACFRHACYISTLERRQELLDLLLGTLSENECDVLAWSILPNHYHLLVRVKRFAALARSIGLVHGSRAREWNLLDATPGRKVWYRYTDRAIRDERHYFATLNYIHFNPVKHGWSKSPYEWEVSSLGFYKEQSGVEWLRDCWQRYPVLDYGKGWDD